jgi:hypothetical protein
MTEINRQLVALSPMIEKICAEVSDDTAKILLELARGLTGSPLGDGDGNIIHAQRLLEKRLAKIVVVDGSPEFHRLIESSKRSSAARVPIVPTVSGRENLEPEEK